MTAERSSWERRLESLDEQLAAFGIRTRDDAAEASTSEPDDRHDTMVVNDPPPADHPAASEPGTLGAVAVTGETGVVQRDRTSADDDGTADERAGTDDDSPAADAVAAGDTIVADGEDASGDDAAMDSDEDDDAHEPASRHRAVLDWIVVVGVALLVAFLVRTFVLAHFVVDGVSMSTTLHSDDRVFVNKLSYRLHDPNRGDVVVLHELTGAKSRDLIKRVVGLPGETLEVRSCSVIIDGQVLDEPYLDPEALAPATCSPVDPQGNFDAVTIPDGHVFVMGDNRGQSQDSRALGAIDEDELVGRAFVVFWPRSSWQWL